MPAMRCNTLTLMIWTNPLFLPEQFECLLHYVSETIHFLSYFQQGLFLNSFLSLFSVLVTVVFLYVVVYKLNAESSLFQCS